MGIAWVKHGGEDALLWCSQEGGVSISPYPPHLQEDWVRVRQDEVAQP